MFQRIASAMVLFLVLVVSGGVAANDSQTACPGEAELIRSLLAGYGEHSQVVCEEGGVFLRSPKEGVIRFVQNDFGWGVVQNPSRQGRVLKLSLSVPRDRLYNDYNFFGLANYYENIAPVSIVADGGEVSLVGDDGNEYLGAEGWYGWKGRYGVVLLRAPGADISFTKSGMDLSWGGASVSQLQFATRFPHLNGNGKAGSEINSQAIRYTHLWEWLAGLSRLVEASVVELSKLMGLGFGWAIILFAIIVKLVLLPVSIKTAQLQREVSRIQSVLEPKLAKIKSAFDGEEAHNKIMEAYKEQCVTPFYTLKPLAGSLVQVPVLVAIFAALGEMPQLYGEGFLWIDNLAHPDSIATLPVMIPFLGDQLSLLPLVMTVVTILAAVLHRDPHATPANQKRQKRNLYLLAAAFFILFYPFPAAMVLYWTLANALHLVQQRVGQSRVAGA